MPRHPSPLPWLMLLMLLALLAGCGATPASTAGGPAYDLEELAVSAPILGELVRAGQVCGVPVSLTALDRAARIEAAAIELHERQGGTVARDNFLRSMAPPRFEARQRGRDQSSWCSGKRLEIERVDGFLVGESGGALLHRAEAARASFR